MKIDSSIKKGVISSLIGTIFFLYFIEPISKFFLSIFIFLFDLTSNSMQDRLYAEIALGKTDFAFTGLLMIFILSLMFLILINVRTIFPRKKKTHKVKQETEKKEKIEILRNDNLIGKIIKSGILLFFIVFVSILISFSFIKINTIDRFEQHIKILTPYITPYEKNMLISDFSKMHSKSEYITLYRKIYFIAEDNNINLPETTNYLY